MSNADVVVTGNVTADPELKYASNGSARVSFSVASERRYQVNGEWTGETSFFNVVAWRKVAEDAASILEKGLPVLVKGRLEQRTWQDKESGANRSTVELVADTVGVNVYGIENVTRKARKDSSAGSSTPAREKATVPSSDPFEDF
tara:strand:+ start:199 stop:633 length:435 start_codon:yes stop_codon:yes gene_type:complete